MTSFDPIANIELRCDCAAMAELLHEFWRSEERGEFGPVTKEGDEFRAKMSPEFEFQFEIWACSWREAMRLYEERAYGEFGKSYDHMPEEGYTDAAAETQQSYLRVRGKIR